MAGTVMRRTTIDRFRYVIEQMPPSNYLASSYYERWLWAIEHLAAEQGLLDGPGADPGRRGAPSSAPPREGRFSPGDRVRVVNRVTGGHCRVPRYLRQHVGTVEKAAFSWPDPTESAATGVYGAPQPVYTVVFSGEELFGAAADHAISADLGEHDLEVP
jgi:nitrile hydratase